MSSIIENANRIAAVTSSEIWKIMTNGKGDGGMGAPGMTYLKEKRLEKKLGRSIKTDAYSRAMQWGSFMESRVFNLLGFEYQLLSSETNVHPTIKGWAGSMDLFVPGVKIGEIKCYEPKNFAEYSDALLTQDVDFLRKECPEEYWQCCSNAILASVDRAEGICYMPYQSELNEIREMAENYDGADQWKVRFIVESEDAALPYLPNDSEYKNLNRFEFEVPQADKDALTARVEMFLEYLNA